MLKVTAVDLNTLWLSDGRKIELLGVEPSPLVESYLGEAFGKDVIQQPVTYVFDSHAIPRRPERQQLIKAYVTDAKGVSINALLIKERVSAFVERDVQDSLFQFRNYRDTNNESEEVNFSDGIDDIIAPASFSIAVIRNNGARSRGSGFFISPDGVGVSNYHVMSEANSAIVTRCADGSSFEVIEVIDYSQEDDYCVFRVAGGSDFSYLENAKYSPRQGEPIYVYGTPKGLSCTLSSGVVSALREDGRVIQIDAAISPGSSGSPVFNANFKVVGIATYKYIECENCNAAYSTELFQEHFRRD